MIVYRHMFFPGSARAYTPEQLEEYKNATVTYGDKEMSYYDATQKQRSIERAIRQSKRELVALDEAIKNTPDGETKDALKLDFEQTAVKLKGQEAKIRDFCSKTGLERDHYREQVFAAKTENGIAGFGRSTSGKAVHRAKEHYKDFVKVVGKVNAPETLDKYYELKYNNPEGYRFLRTNYNRRKKLIDDPSLKLPNAEAVTIDPRKFTHYLFGGTLKRGLSKGNAITSHWGYDISNWEQLRDDIVKHAAVFPATLKDDGAYGAQYEQKMILYGPNGKPGNLLVGWTVDGAGTHMATTFLEKL